MALPSRVCPVLLRGGGRRCKKAENLSRRAEEEFRCALALKPSPAFKAECKEFLAWIKEDFSSYEKGIKPAKRE